MAEGWINLDYFLVGCSKAELLINEAEVYVTATPGPSFIHFIIVEKKDSKFLSIPLSFLK